MENRKQQIVDRVSGSAEVSPVDALASSMALEYLRIALSGGLAMSDDASGIRNKLFSPMSGGASTRASDSDWGRLLTNVMSVARKSELEENKTFLFGLPNTRLGRPSDAEPRKIFYNRLFLDEAFSRINKLNWDATPLLPAEPIAQKDVHTRAMIQLQELLPRAKQVLNGEFERLRSLIGKAEELLGKDLEEANWAKFSQEMVLFLRDLNEQYRISFKSELMTGAESIKQSKARLSSIVRNGGALTEASSFSALMQFFSSDPCAVLENALRSIENVCVSAQSYAEDADKCYARIKDDSTIQPARLQGLIEGMNQIDQRIRVLRGEPDAE